MIITFMATVWQSGENTAQITLTKRSAGTKKSQQKDFPNEANVGFPLIPWRSSKQSPIDLRYSSVSVGVDQLVEIRLPLVQKVRKRVDTTLPSRPVQEN